MTVAELIEELKKYPPDTSVYLSAEGARDTIDVQAEQVFPSSKYDDEPLVTIQGRHP